MVRPGLPIIILLFVILPGALILPVHAETANDLLNVGVGLYKAGNYTGALSYFNRGLAIEPDNANLLWNASVVMSKLGMTKEANETQWKAHSIDPQMNYWESSSGYSQLCAGYWENGMSYVEQKRYKEALFQFQRVAELCPTDIDTDIRHCYVADIYTKLGMPDEAAAEYKAGIALMRTRVAAEPDNLRYQWNLETALYNLNKIESKAAATTAITTQTIQNGSSDLTGVNSTYPTRSLLPRTTRSLVPTTPPPSAPVPTTRSSSSFVTAVVAMIGIGIIAWNRGRNFQ